MKTSIGFVVVALAAFVAGCASPCSSLQDVCDKCADKAVQQQCDSVVTAGNADQCDAAVDAYGAIGCK
jgi:hypothetical protein